jgi:hypothetical protein
MFRLASETQTGEDSWSGSNICAASSSIRAARLGLIE